MTEITGEQLYHAFASGGRAVIEERDILNKMNVFPIPDGDTGSNLSYTLQNIIENSKIHDSAGYTMQSLAESALIGARGNSGILFAQFVSGMAEIVGSESQLNIDTFSDSASHAVKQAYKAVSNPVEGTMLTVMKDWAESLQKGKKELKEKRTFKKIIENSLEQAITSLQKTKFMLESLRKANVIDAGAKGFVTFLHGFHDFFSKGGKIHKIEEDFDAPSIDYIDEHLEEITADEDLSQRYCTEGIIRGENLDQEEIRSKIAPFGNELIVAGTSKAIRIHIHSNEPASVFEELGKLGKLGSQKVDDMLRQYQMVHNRTKSVAIVVDSTCDLPEKYLDEHQIYQVPLFINFGETTYIDRITLKEEQFYPMLKKSKLFPKTSQPNVSSFVRLFDQLKSYYDSILSIHISSNLSGTYSTSLKAAEKVNSEKIHIMDSKEVAVGLGLIVMEAVDDIDAGKDIQEIKERINRNKANLTTLVTVPKLDNFVKGGRVSPIKGIIGKILNVKPIISLDGEGKTITLGKANSIEKARQKVLAEITKRHKEQPIRRFAVGHAQVPNEAELMASEISKITGIEPSYITEVSPVLGAHSGFGCTDIAILQ